MAIFVRRDRDQDRKPPTETRLPEGEVNSDMVRRIEAYTVPRSPTATASATGSCGSTSRRSCAPPSS